MFRSYRDKPDLRSRAAMTAFLRGHFRYHTMNSWNRSTSYANRVKLDRLAVPADKYDLALDVLFGGVQCPDWDDARDALTRRFAEETGFEVGFNGRSGGYLVLYQAGVDPKSGRPVTYLGRPVDQDEDFENWSMADLRERVRVVDALDQLCDDLRNQLVNILSTYETRTDVVLSAHEVRTLVPPSELDGDEAGPRR